MAGLGKGLGALLSDATEEYMAHKDGMLEKGENDITQELLLSNIYPNVNQPRKLFDPVALEELVNSIRLHGVISPIIVVKQGDGYMIIAGERRFRAAKKAGLIKIPAIVRDYTPKQVKEISLIENLQREDLNPIETANAIKQLMDDYKYTQEEVADRVGKSRPAIANTLRLLSLCPKVLDMVANGKLSAGHARCLVVVESEKLQIELAEQAISTEMSVREFEKKVKDVLHPKKPEKKTPEAQEQSLELIDMVARMQKVFATKVRAIGNDNKGRIYIDYFTRDDLDRIVELLESIEDKKKD